MVWDSRNLGEREEWEPPLSEKEFRELYTCKHGYCPHWECPKCQEETRKFWEDIERRKKYEEELREKGSFKDILQYFNGQVKDKKVHIKVYTFNDEEEMELSVAINYMKFLGRSESTIRLAQKLQEMAGEILKK